MTPLERVPEKAEATPSTARTEHPHRLVPAILLGLAVGLVVLSLQLDLGTASSPGPGVWPLVTSVVMALAAAFLLVTGADRPEPVDAPTIVRVGGGVVAIALFALLMPLVGMPFPALVTVGAWLRLFGERWVVSAVGAVTAAILLQILFVQLLGVALPVGPLAPGRW